MFTGIIEAVGCITQIEKIGSNSVFTIQSSVSQELKIDQSVAHNGVCLTIEKIHNGCHQVTAVAETLSKTNLNQWYAGTQINIERCMTLNGRLDGHIVQGHIDTTAVCKYIMDLDGSWQFTFNVDALFAPLMIEKGSISVNGVSLTLFNVTQSSFTVAIIPFTYEHTNFKNIKEGDLVNIEFDILGKYVQRMLQFNV